MSIYFHIDRYKRILQLIKNEGRFEY